MKITEKTTVRIELEDGDTVWDLWQKIGRDYGSDHPISGSVEIRDPE